MPAEEPRPDESAVPEPDAPDVHDEEDETEVIAHAEPTPWCVGCFG
ncbi:hypothetical protein [Actinokineospora sp. NPDC004072]